MQNLRTVTAAFADHSQDVGIILDNANASVVEMKSLLHNVDQSYTARGGLKDQVSQTLKDYDRVATNLSDTSPSIAADTRRKPLWVAKFQSKRRCPELTILSTMRNVWQKILNQFVVQLQRDPTRLLFGDRRQGYQPR